MKDNGDSTSVRDASKAAQAQIVAERAEGEYMIMQRRGERWEFFSRYSFDHEYAAQYVTELRSELPTYRFGLFKVCVLEEIGDGQLVQVPTASTSEYTVAQRQAGADSSHKLIDPYPGITTWGDMMAHQGMGIVEREEAFSRLVEERGQLLPEHVVDTESEDDHVSR